MAQNVLSLRSLVTVTQVTAVRQIQTHETLMRLHESLVDLQVGRAAGQSLHVDAPFGVVEVEDLQGTGLAGQLDGVDVLVAAVVAGAGVALGVFVGHGRAQGVEDGARRDILRGDEENGLALALDFFLLKNS
jgi:hypothetical protein